MHSATSWHRRVSEAGRVVVVIITRAKRWPVVVPAMLGLKG
jgi:hypothetical protein